MIDIEIVYARSGIAKDQALVSITLPDNTTVADAIQQSKLYRKFALSFKNGKLVDDNNNSLDTGIFARRVMLDTQLKQGDRIEIYRKLHVDPKQARLLRAKGAK